MEVESTKSSILKETATRLWIWTAIELRDRNQDCWKRHKSMRKQSQAMQEGVRINLLQLELEAIYRIIEIYINDDEKW